MEQIFDAATAIMGGTNLSSALAIFKISTGETTIETLFQSLIDGLTKFIQSLFSSIQ